MKQSFQYVPLLEQLSELLKHDELKRVCLTERSSDLADAERVFADFKTGENHRHEDGLSLIIYYDDFNVVNPVGNKVKQNKLGAFYFAVGNTPFRSRKRHIFLLALFKTSYLKGQHGPRIISTIVEDLKRLEDTGISVQDGPRSVLVKGFLSLFVGDNLAVHSIGGFFESFSRVKKVSRYCNCSSNDIQTNLSVTSCRLQTVEEYDARVDELKLRNFDRELCKEYGIKATCGFNDLRHFHIIECTPPDLAHDLYEGAVPLVIGKVLGELIKLKIVSLSEINTNITHFPYSRNDARNKPQPVSLNCGKVKCTETAKEAFNLLRLLPLIIGYKVPRDLPVWNILLSFVAIVRSFAAPKVNERDLGSIQAAVEAWLASFLHHFQGIRVTPKLHYILHYTNQIKKHGALSRITTLRFEGKHQALKQHLATSKNYKNVCKTIAEKHQQWKAEKLRSDDFFSWKDSFSPSRIHEHSDGVAGSTNVVIRGTAYRSGDVVAVTEGDDVQFGAIVYVQRAHDGYSFVCKRLQVIEFDNHVGAFYVTKTEDEVVIKHGELADYHPLHLYGGRYVVEHHTLATRATYESACWNQNKGMFLSTRPRPLIAYP